MVNSGLKGLTSNCVYQAFTFIILPQAESSEEMEASTDMGLVKGHAYGITAVKRPALEGSSDGLLSFFTKEKLSMIRLRNPWGASEWKGAFSDG